MILFTIYDLFTKMLYNRDGRKNRNTKTNAKTKEKFRGGRLFSGVWKNRKQAGPTQVEEGF